MTHSQGAASPRARRRPRRSRRSPTTRSCPTATPAPSSRPMARSTGSACRASTRRASSARCSTARPARFRLAPFGINVPTARIYEPGTNIARHDLEHPDRLGPGARRADHGPTATARTRSRRTRARRPTRTRDHMLVRTVALPRGRGRGRAGLRAGLRLRPRAGRVVAGRRRPPHGRRHRRRPDDPAATDMALGIEGDRVRARHTLKQGEQALLRALLGRGPGRAAGHRRGQRAAGRHHALLARWLDRARLPDHRWRDPIQRSALAIKGLTYMPTGATVAALDHLAARDARRGAQLGLPLHLDPRLDLHPAGAALPQPGLGGRRVHAVRRRPRAERRRRAADHVRDRRPARPDRVHPRRPLRLRGREARCGSATAPSTSARTTCSAPRSTRSCCTRRRSQRLPRRLWPIVAGPGGVRDRGLAQPRPGHLGGPRRAAALRVVEADVLGRARPRGQAGRHPRRPGADRDLGRHRRRDQGGHPRARRARRRPAPALRHRRARRVHAAGGDLRLPARATTSACARASRRSPTT